MLPSTFDMTFVVEKLTKSEVVKKLEDSYRVNDIEYEINLGCHVNIHSFTRQRWVLNQGLLTKLFCGKQLSLDERGRVYSNTFENLEEAKFIANLLVKSLVDNNLISNQTVPKDPVRTIKGSMNLDGNIDLTKILVANKGTLESFDLHPQTSLRLRSWSTLRAPSLSNLPLNSTRNHSGSLLTWKELKFWQSPPPNMPNAWAWMFQINIWIDLELLWKWELIIIRSSRFIHSRFKIYGSSNKHCFRTASSLSRCCHGCGSRCCCVVVLFHIEPN